MAANNTFMHRPIRPRAAMFIVGTVLAATLLVEWGAYQSGVRAEARATARKELPKNFCVSCHSDPKTLRVMLEKDDNNGTAAYCAGAQLPSRQDLAKDQVSSSIKHNNASISPLSK